MRLFPSLKLDEPLLNVRVLASRDYRIAVILVAALEMILIGSSVALPLYIQNALGYSPTISGFSMLPGAVIGAVCALYSGRLFDRFGVRGIAVGGGAAAAVAGVLLVLLQADTSIFIVAVVYTVLTMAIQLLFTPLNSWGLNSLDNKVIQHANALSNTLNQVGGSFGTALIVSMSAMAGSVYFSAPESDLVYLGQHLSFITMAVVLVLIFVAILIFVRQKKGEKGQQHAGSTTSVLHLYNETVMPRAVANAHAGVSVTLSEAEWLVGDVMNPGSPSLSDKSTVRDAVNVLSMTETSGFPIIDEERHVVGFLSDGDLMKYLSAEDVDFANGYMLYRALDDQDLQQRLDTMLDLNVCAIATRRAICLKEDMLLEEACKQLAGRRIKKMPVIDDEGKLVGCLSRRNIIAAMGYYLTSAEPLFTPQMVREKNALAVTAKAGAEA